LETNSIGYGWLDGGDKLGKRLNSLDSAAIKEEEEKEEEEDKEKKRKNN